MIAIDRYHLPDDIPTLKGMIGQLLDIIEAQQRVIDEQQQIIRAQALRIDEQQKIIEAQAARIACLEQEVAALKRHRYGRRAERLPDEKKEGKAQGLPRGHRDPLPAHLPRQQIHHEIADPFCPACGDRMVEMGILRSEQLDLVPARVRVLEHVRHQYACRRCQDQVMVAAKPAQPIDKGIPTPAMLSEILVSKYGDHLPLYRQVQRFERLGVSLSRSTLSRWVMHSGMLLMPIVERMAEKVLRPCGHIFTDDTPMPVQASGRCRKGRFWIYTSKGRGNYGACTVYDFTPTRQGQGPKAFLQGFTGHVQADAYAGYHETYEHQEGIFENGCWAHVRRKYYEVALASRTPGLAHAALAYIKALYEIERQAADLQVEERRLYRKKYARPQLKDVSGILCKWFLFTGHMV